MQSSKRTQRGRGKASLGKSMAQLSLAEREQRDRTSPPQLDIVTVHSKSVTLQTSAAQTDFDFTQLMIARFLSMATGTTTAYPIPYSTKIRRVRIWAAANALAASTTVNLEWNNASTGFLSNNLVVSDTTVSSTIPAYISTRPPKNTEAAWWCAGGGGATGATNALFTVSCPGGALIRIDYDFTLNATEPASSSFTVAAATVGTVFAQNPSATILVSAGLNAYF
jgi:hypothetical protein